ncbi:hypothetical protein NDU88_006269 [Pleurodeles waltl]|uniref:Uncharacterized protein n=1 Tax=Pleurodeles waltl TaxID=8319 RepID=A0AAV7PI54_PLEWA|nr:hypothetical protein NDU88_006269 [Pleurodeles waltl]
MCTEPGAVAASSSWRGSWVITEISTRLYVRLWLTLDLDVLLDNRERSQQVWEDKEQELQRLLTSVVALSVGGSEECPKAEVLEDGSNPKGMRMPEDSRELEFCAEEEQKLCKSSPEGTTRTRHGTELHAQPGLRLPVSRV